MSCRSTWLMEDLTASRKQRHTARRVWQLLAEVIAAHPKSSGLLMEFPHLVGVLSRLWWVTSAGCLIFTRFSVSALLLLQYGTLVLWPAWRNDSQYLRPLAAIVALGVISAFAAESLLSPLRRKSPGVLQGTWAWCTPGTAKCVFITGLAATLASPLLGIGTFASQAGRAQPSLLSPVVTPLILWVYVGLGMILYCHLRGDMSRLETARWVAASFVVFLVYSVLVSRTAPLASYGLAATAGCVAVGVIRVRTFVFLMLAAGLIWPVLYDIRNENRAATGVARYGQTVDAHDRLREDLLMEDAIRFGGPLDLGQLSIAQTLRYGLIPRALDQGRPPVRTGGALSLRLGSTYTSNSTTTILGNVFILSGGTIGVVLIPFFLAAAVSLLFMRPNPLGLALIVAAWESIVWIESIWPDGLGATMQVVVAAIVAVFVVHVAQSVHGLIGRTIKSHGGPRDRNIEPAREMPTSARTARRI